MKREYLLEEGLKWRETDPSQYEKERVNLLKAHLREAMKVPFYQERFSRIGFDPEDIKTLKDVESMPLTSRADLDEKWDKFDRSSSLDIRDISLTSGTTGRPVVVPYTANDLERLAYNEQMAFWGAGIRSRDTLLLCVTLDRCFVAGVAYFSGAIRLGATVIRSGPGNPARQWELIRRLRPTAIVGVPSFLLNMALWGKEHGIDPKDAGIRSLVVIGEPVRRYDHTLTLLGKKLKELWLANICSSYGATELETGFTECKAGCGGHIHPDLCVVEIVDDEGKTVSPGDAGEVVVTPLGVEGLPLVRFRTGDVARIHEGPCPCGWRTPRLGPVEGRLAQRLKFKGTTLYPDMIFSVLQEMGEGTCSYVEVRSSYDLSDEVKVVIGSDESGLDESVVSDLLQARLRVRPEIEVRSREEVLARMTSHGGRKPKRFFDFRKKTG